jgi:PAS domain S-box-containing protein
MLDVVGPDDDRAWTDIPRDNADLLAALVRSSNDAIYSKDDQARITSWNPAAEHLYGYKVDEVLGQPISILIPDDRRGEEIDILNRILQGEEIEHYETMRVRKDGSTVEVSVSISPVHDSEGRVVEAAAIARDISQRRELEEELARAQRKQALELNDEVIQGLATSKMAFEMNDHERGLRALTTALDSAKHIVTRLFDEAGSVDPGELVRSEPAIVDEAKNDT